MTSWGHHVSLLTGEELALAVERGETWGGRNYPKALTRVAACNHVTGRARSISVRSQRVLAGHAAHVTERGTAWCARTSRAARLTSRTPAGDGERKRPADPVQLRGPATRRGRVSAYLARRYAAQLAVPCPWAARARMQRHANTDIDTVLAATELTWCEVHQSAVSECPSPNPTFAARDVWGTPED
jgi:hypothetical protein